jgi:hypothetical protein
MVNHKGFGQEVNGEKTKWVFMFLHQNARQNSDIRTDNRTLSNYANNKYLRMTQNYIHKETWSR